MHRAQRAETFIDAMLPDRFGRNARLERIDALVDWAALEAIVADVYASPRGRPSYRPLVMVKVLLLQEWYRASDAALEEALWDRVSFRRFVALSLDEDSPDHSTISRFRTQLAARGLATQLFRELNRQLEARGLVLKTGTLLDATVVEAQVRKPPAAAGLGAASERDRDAAWTRKRGQSYFGYQAHLGVDEGSGLIRQAQLQPANVNETEVAEAQISGDERAVYADRAFESKARRAQLRERGIKDRILHRRHQYQAQLPHWQQRRNELIEPVRAAVERVFGTLKRSYGYRRVRFIGLQRNTVELLFKCMAFNLRRAERLEFGV